MGIGIGTAAVVLWLTFFGTAGAVELATLIAVVAGAIWMATVDPRRLVDPAGRPNLMLFGLAAVATALVLTSMVVLGSATLFLVMGIALVGFVAGLSRAIGHVVRSR
jgi:hypothetical protein